MSPRPDPETLLPWALSALGETDGTHRPALTPVAGDASSRRYFRFRLGERNHVLVDAPPATEKNGEFLAVRALLAGQGVRVPELLAADLERGYMLLEDLGDRLLLPELDEQSVDGYYRQAFDLLLQMAAADTGETGLENYNRTLLEEELGRFPEWFVEGLLGHAPTAGEQSMLQAVGDRLVQSALEQPRVLVHRDFHSRNLMLVGAGDLAVIDFQDAVVGPVTYDLVSLLRDCYIRWSPSRVRQWALDYYRLLLERDVLEDVGEGHFLRWFDWMGLQRHIKVLGTFARLYLRDGKSTYLDDLPLVIRYVLETLRQYADDEPVFAELEDWFSARMLPLVSQQDWGGGQ
jgi:aminoglycoside/choline kinase family phosphotransferase